MRMRCMYIFLFISMLFLGIIYGFIYHFIIMPYMGNGLIHCIIMGLIFGTLNFLLAIGFIKKYFMVQTNNRILRNEVNKDQLTGLLNRRSFDIDLNELHNYKGSCSIIFIDIDDFKKFNDKYGHQVGDAVLQKVSKAIMGSVRPDDKVYRYGGEEIVVLLKDCNKANAFSTAERIRENIINIENHSYPKITASLGIACYPEDSNDIYETVNISDKNLLKAKSQGKNRCEMDSEMITYAVL